VYGAAADLAKYTMEARLSEAFQRGWAVLQTADGFKLIATLVTFLEPIMALCISLVSFACVG